MRRYIGIDLHTNSFTACILQDGEAEKIQTLPFQGGALERFVETLRSDDELAVEATGNSAWFREQVIGYVARVVIIAPWQFEVIRRSVKKTDRHDARAIAFFLSRDMVPEARVKSKIHVELASAIATRDQLVKLRVLLLNKAHGLFNRHGIRIKKETITSKTGFERAVNSHAWKPLEQVEPEVIAAQLAVIREERQTVEGGNHRCCQNAAGL